MFKLNVLTNKRPSKGAGIRVSPTEGKFIFSQKAMDILKITDGEYAVLARNPEDGNFYVFKGWNNDSGLMGGKVDANRAFSSASSWGAAVEDFGDALPIYLDLSDDGIEVENTDPDGNLIVAYMLSLNEEESEKLQESQENRVTTTKSDSKSTKAIPEL